MNVRDELRSLKKERVLEAAQQLFYERGYRGTTLDAIAESLNVSKPFVYAVYDPEPGDRYADRGAWRGGYPICPDAPIY